MSRALLKDRIFLGMALQLAELSTCLRLQVGCLLLRPDGSIAGGGYNGSLPSMGHCSTATCNPHSRCYNTRHAERSALDYSGESLIGTAYVTHEPCLACTRDLVARGCRRIVYGAPYSSSSPEEIAARTKVIEHHKVQMTFLPSPVSPRPPKNGLPPLMAPPPPAPVLLLLPRASGRACYVAWGGADHAVGLGSFLLLLRLARADASGVRPPLGAMGRKAIERLRLDLARLPGGSRHWVVSAGGRTGRYLWAAGAPMLAFDHIAMRAHPFKLVRSVLRCR